MRLSILVALAENDVIGREGGLPWHLPADLRRFRRLTWGHSIIMGRRTWESIGRALPGRTSVVLSRDPEWRPEIREPSNASPAGEPGTVHVARSLEEALSICGDIDEAFVIGGRELFERALPLADRIHETRIHAAVEGDVRFELGPLEGWRLASEETRPPDAKNPYPLTFRVWEREGRERA